MNPYLLQNRTQAVVRAVAGHYRIPVESLKFEPWKWAGGVYETMAVLLAEYAPYPNPRSDYVVARIERAAPNIDPALRERVVDALRLV